MPDCPHCRRYYFGNPDQCPNCYYDFKAKAVRKPQDVIEREQREIEQLAKERNERARAAAHSARYEYATEYLGDSSNGVVSKSELNAVLTKYSANGWRLHSVFTNEAGKNCSSVGFGGINVGTNATIDVTILIFERCIKLAD